MGLWEQRDATVRYGVAVGAVLVAVAARAALTPWWGPYAYPIALFVPAVIFATWFGGLGPGLLSMLLSVAAIVSLFLDPAPEAKIVLTHSSALGMFVLALVGVGAAFELLHRAVRRARAEGEERRRANLALAASEERFRALADRAPVMLWRTDADGACVYLSQFWHEFTGQPQGDSLGLGWLDAVHDEDRPRVLEAFRTAQKARAAFSAEYRMRRLSDGQTRWFIDSGNPLFEGGRFVGYAGAVVDVTERRRADFARQQFAGAIEASGDPILIFDPDLRATYVNSAGLVLAGLGSVAEAAHHVLTDFFCEQDRALIRDGFVPSVLKDGHGKLDVRFRRMRHDGAVWVNLGMTALRDDNGALLGLAAVARDITESRAAADALRRKEQQLRTVTELAAAEIVQVDRDMRYQFANTAYAKRWARHPDDLVGRTVLEVLGPATVESLRPYTDQVFAGRRVEFEDSIRYDNGTARWVHATLVPQVDERGEVTGLVASIEDITERRRAEERLRESEQRFRSLTDGLPLIVWVHGPRGEQQSVNRTFCEFFGVAPGEMTGDRWQTLVHPEDLGRYAADFGRAVEARADFHGETRVRRADGAWRWIESWARPRVSATGEFLGYIGTSADITERKAAEQALRESELRARARAEELAAIMEAVPALTVIARDATCLRLSSNRAAREKLRVPADRNMSKSAPAHEGPTYRVFKDGRELAARELPLQRAAATGHETENEEFELVFDDVPPMHILGRAVPLFDEAGAVRGAVAAFLDVTKQKAAELALQASDKRLKLALAGAGMGVWSWNMRTDRVEWSPEVYRLFHVDDFAGTGAAFSRFVHPDDTEILWQAVHEAVRSRTLYHHEFRIVRGDGVARWMADRGVVDLDAQGEVRGLVGVVLDVTDLKRSQRQLEAARDEAIAANKAKDGFFAALSHELRTPLNPVLLIASENAADPSLPEPVRQDFEFIAQNINFEAKLIDDLLDYNRISRGVIRLQSEPVDLHELLVSAMAVFEPDAGARQIALERAFQAGDAIIRGDAVRLRQVFWNVIKNAVKFTGGGGRVVVETQNTSGSPRAILVRVRDSGIGMTPEELQRAFQPFSQGDHAHARSGSDFGGLGLGLAISRQLVELHQGRIFAESSGPGQGTTVTLEFAVLPQAGAARERRGGQADATPFS